MLPYEKIFSPIPLLSLAILIKAGSTNASNETVVFRDGLNEIIFGCDTDADCPESMLCRLTCERTCRSMCVLQEKRHRDEDLSWLKNEVSTAKAQIVRDPPGSETGEAAETAESSEEHPFSLGSNPFTESEGEKVPSSLNEFGFAGGTLVTTTTAANDFANEVTTSTEHAEVATEQQQQHSKEDAERGEQTFRGVSQVFPPSFSPEPPGFFTETPTQTPPTETTPTLEFGDSLEETIGTDKYEPQNNRVDLWRTRIKTASITKKPMGNSRNRTSSRPRTTTTTTPVTNIEASTPEGFEGGPLPPASRITGRTTTTVEPLVPVAVPKLAKMGAKGKKKGTNLVEKKTQRPLHAISSTVPNSVDRDGCPAPKVCRKNCGVVIDADGCQGCECLWISTPCTIKADCEEEGQFCDLGRCECQPGWEHDREESGVCQRIGKPKSTDRGVTKERTIAQNGIVVASSSGNNWIVSGLARPLRKSPQIRRPPSDALFDSIVSNRRKKRGVDGGNQPQPALPTALRSNQVPIGKMVEKPFREERLQGPGVCESDEDCRQPDLYCVLGDCWELPERESQRYHNAEIADPFEDATDRLTNNSPTVDYSFLPKNSTWSRRVEGETLFPLADQLRNKSGPSHTLHREHSPETVTMQQQEGIANPKTHINEAPSWHRPKPRIGPPSIQPPEVSTRSPLEIAKEMQLRQQQRAHYSIPNRIGEGQAVRVEFPLQGILGRELEKLATSPTAIRRTDGEKDFITTMQPIAFTTQPPATNVLDKSSGVQVLPSGEWQRAVHRVAASPLAALKATTGDRKIFYDYSQRNRLHRPIRVELMDAEVKHECDLHRDCGDHYLCCKKRWCDLSKQCGMARFCLPDCKYTKMTHLSSVLSNGGSLFDLVYD